jgi:hypothetical protein
LQCEISPVNFYGADYLCSELHQFAFLHVSMHTMKKFYLSIVLALIAHNAFSQSPQDVENELARLGINSVQLRTEEERLAASDTFSMLLDQIINSEAAFNHPFEKVKNLSKLQSPDQNFRIYTWSVPLRNGSFAFYGRLVFKEKNTFSVIALIDNGVNIENPEFQLLKADQWYGAVYYDIIKTKHKKNTYYTLLGYRPNNSSHNEKVLEVLATDNLEPVRFGSRIFNTPTLNGMNYQRPPFRLILRYNPKTVAFLRYMAQDDKIIMDHLAPPDASQKGLWAYYGQDFTYDALFWEEGMWQLQENIALKGTSQPNTVSPPQQGLPEKQ